MMERAEVWFHLLLALSVGTIVCVTAFAHRRRTGGSLREPTSDSRMIYSLR
jgi:hypothetical protein